VGAGGEAIVVALNMSAQQQTISLELAACGLAGSRLTTLLASPAPIAGGAADRAITLAPFAAWVASLR
jgi:alpha-glucosidase